MTVLTVRHPSSYPAERAYVLEVVLHERLGLEHVAVAEDRDDVLVTDGTAELRVPDTLFATREEDWLTSRFTPPTDPFGIVFFHLTRYEELVVRERDRHDRFSGAVPRTPVADDAVESLRTDLQRAFPRIETKRGSFTVLPSHDVDIPRCPGISLRTAAIDVVIRRDARLALRRLSPLHDPCETFDFLLDASERRGLRSTFFFMAGPTGSELDGSYRLDDPWIRALLRRVGERGHELGLHPSYGTFRSPATIAAELERLQAACAAEGIDQSSWGGRQHYLRWENPTTWRAYAEAGLAYDSSLHVPEHPGFRAGTCFEYPVFDLEARAGLPLRELPLVAMEASFLQYLRLSHGQAYDEMIQLKRECRRVGGTFTFLWHNNRLQSSRDRALYEAVLDG